MLARVARARPLAWPRAVGIAQEATKRRGGDRAALSPLRFRHKSAAQSGSRGGLAGDPTAAVSARRRASATTHRPASAAARRSRTRTPALSRPRRPGRATWSRRGRRRRRPRRRARPPRRSPPRSRSRARRRRHGPCRAEPPGRPRRRGRRGRPRRRRCEYADVRPTPAPTAATPRGAAGRASARLPAAAQRGGRRPRWSIRLRRAGRGRSAAPAGLPRRRRRRATRCGGPSAVGRSPPRRRGGRPSSRPPSARRGAGGPPRAAASGRCTEPGTNPPPTRPPRGRPRGGRRPLRQLVGQPVDLDRAAPRQRMPAHGAAGMLAGDRAEHRPEARGSSSASRPVASIGLRRQCEHRDVAGEDERRQLSGARPGRDVHGARQVPGVERRGARARRRRRHRRAARRPPAPGRRPDARWPRSPERLSGNEPATPRRPPPPSRTGRARAPARTRRRPRAHSCRCRRRARPS